MSRTEQTSRQELGVGIGPATRAGAAVGGGTVIGTGMGVVAWTGVGTGIGTIGTTIRTCTEIETRPGRERGRDVNWCGDRIRDRRYDMGSSRGRDREKEFCRENDSGCDMVRGRDRDRDSSRDKSRDICRDRDKDRAGKSVVTGVV